jgi:hypothetical protein
MFELKRALLAAVLSAAAVVAVAVPAATADDEKGKGKKPEPPAADSGKPIIIQIDASKLPPEVLKELLKLSKTTEPTKPGTKPGTKPEPTKPGVKPDTSKPEPTKPGIKPGVKPEPTKPGSEPVKPGTKPEPTKTVKSISLADAIAIAEKATAGTVVKAERKDEDGKVQFKLDVIDGKGGKSKVTLDAGGKLTDTEKKGDEDKDEKGKKKK